MQKITPHLWFDKEAKDAAEFYTSIFPESKIKNITTLHDTPSGDCDVVSFEIAGQSFMAISAGPLFKFNPSISFHVKCKTTQEVDKIWEKLSKGGTVLMELGEYPFSKRYGWVQDKYGLSWQVVYAGDGEIKQVITPVLLFVNEAGGRTEEAVNFYTSVFKNAKVDAMMKYGKGEGSDKEGTVKYTSFVLEGQEFGAMDGSAREHNFTFNEAISFIVHCKTQEEIDYYWNKLSHVPESEQCGWLKDKYGLSWQIVPAFMDEMMADKDLKRLARVTEAFLKMKKFDIAGLQRAYEGRPEV
ncbi:VOC family protein [Candidatus Woesearchaeota archaeon]|nr:VOC family protein [Candidatus Woesearchaeota archaeon]